MFCFRSLKEANIKPQEIDCVCYTKGYFNDDVILKA